IVRTGCNDDLWIKLMVIHSYFDKILKIFNKSHKCVDNTALQAFHTKNKLSTGVWKTRQKPTIN
nr:hypothetical protein [Clostridiales bacterium]